LGQVGAEQRLATREMYVKDAKVDGLAYHSEPILGPQFIPVRF
jgi:hypothetical protein